MDGIDPKGGRCRLENDSPKSLVDKRGWGLAAGLQLALGGVACLLACLLLHGGVRETDGNVCAFQQTIALCQSGRDMGLCRRRWAMCLVL